MSVMQAVGALVGGVGLFLLGMWLMTEGLKGASGPMLRRTLARGTATAVRGVLVGTGLTAVVQSSSAVTVAVVGFVNAGLMRLREAVWIIYGCNIGTTLTGWIVALTGVAVKLDAYALPLIGIGMFLRLGRGRWAPAGQALAGFAVFLLGIQALKSELSWVAQLVDVSAVENLGLLSGAAHFLLGMVLTLIIQSSSATTAIAISAGSAGILSIPMAALMVIGSDLGTSSTAAVSALGTTAAARRAAWAHVVYNIATALFGVVILLPLLAAIGWAFTWSGIEADAGVQLAAFSTTFNTLGVLVMAPFTPRLVRWLEGLFVSEADELSRLRHLDAQSAQVPDLLARNARAEVERVGAASVALARNQWLRDIPDLPDFERRRHALMELIDRIQEAIAHGTRRRLPEPVTDALSHLLRALQHVDDVLELLGGAAALGRLPIQRPEIARFERRALEALAVLWSGEDFAELDATAAMEGVEAAYDAAKQTLLAAAAQGALRLDDLEAAIDRSAAVRDVLRHLHKAAMRVARSRSAST